MNDPLAQAEIRRKVIKCIQKRHGEKFRVLDNTGQDKKVVAGAFPDVIFMQPEPPPNNNIFFVMKIETSDNLIDSVSEWKSLGSTPSVLYLVLPQDKLDEAKKLVSATQVRARFAWYEITGDTAKIHYE